MAKWNDFPKEIQLAILCLYCNNILIEFSTSVKESLRGQHPYKLYEELKKLVWPEPPKSLKSFASVLKTCRSFHDIVSNEIRIEGSSPSQVLQQLQYDGMSRLERAFHDRWEHIYQLLDESCYVHFMYLVLGCFWKNPIAFNKWNRFGWLLMRIPQRSRLILIPHLEPWLLFEKAKEDDMDDVDSGEDEDDDELLDGETRPWSERLTNSSKKAPFTLTLGVSGNLDHCREMRLEQGAFRIYEEPLAIVSIAGLAGETTKTETNDHELVQQTFDRSCDPDLPVVCDIREDEPDTWWLFPPEDFYDVKVHREECGRAEYYNHWFLVNYERRKLYMGPDGTEAYHWDDVWDIPAQRPRPLNRSSRIRPNLVDKEVQTESCSSAFGESQLCFMVSHPEMVLICRCLDRTFI